MGSIEVIPRGAAIGAEVRCGDLREIDDGTFGAIRAAWLDHLVLLFRGQDLDDTELTRFGQRFGGLVVGSKRFADIRQRPAEFPYINVISNVIGADGVPIGNLGFGEAVWHTDMSMFEVPASFTFLYGEQVQKIGRAHV